MPAEGAFPHPALSALPADRDVGGGSGVGLSPARPAPLASGRLGRPFRLSLRPDGPPGPPGERGAGVPSVPLPSAAAAGRSGHGRRSEEHTSELQSLMRISYAVICMKKKRII